MECELAWAAGFFDGEGCAYKRTYKNTYLYLEVAQRELQPLERFIMAVGQGKITPRPKRGHTKEHWVWACYDKDGVSDVVNKLWPYLSEPKKTKIASITGKGGSCGV